MGCNNYWKAKLMLDSAKNRWIKVDGSLQDESGIYVLTREEEGIKYGYVGQSLKVLTRLGQHLLGYQHIDLSLKKHGLFDILKNKTGYKVQVLYYPENELNEKEKYWIKYYSNAGYQLRNKTLGGQGAGKNGLDNQKASKGYYDGLKQGYLNAYKEVKEYFDKYLDVQYKADVCQKKNGDVKEIFIRKYNEFQEKIK